MHARERRDVSAVQELESIRRERSDDSDERLGTRIHQQRLPRAERAGEDDRPAPEAAEEDRDQRRRGVDRIAEDQPEILQPDDLVEERTDARREENQEENATTHLEEG